MIGRGQREVHCAVYTKRILFIYKVCIIEVCIQKVYFFCWNDDLVFCILFVYFTVCTFCILYFVVCLLCRNCAYLEYTFSIQKVYSMKVLIIMKNYTKSILLEYTFCIK